MSLTQILVLALIQGLTEFLPVSSSAHLILGSWLMKWPDQGLVIDVAIHFGTLFAVVVYFRCDLREMLVAWKHVGGEEQQFAQRQLGKHILYASVPVLLAGALLHAWVEASLRDVRVIAVTPMVFGLRCDDDHGADAGIRRHGIGPLFVSAGDPGTWSGRGLRRLAHAQSRHVAGLGHVPVGRDDLGNGGLCLHQGISRAARKTGTVTVHPLSLGAWRLPALHRFLAPNRCILFVVMCHNSARPLAVVLR